MMASCPSNDYRGPAACDFLDELPDALDVESSTDDSIDDARKASGMLMDERELLASLENQLDPDDIAMDRSGGLLGRGGGGVVLRGFHRPTKTPLALKVSKMDDKDRRAQFINDLYASLHVTSSPFIVTLYGAYIHSESGCFHTALEFMDRGSLLDLRNRSPGIPEEYLSYITHQILEGLHCLHDNNFLHRDIKLSNILINSEGAVKITDFGISKCLWNTTHCNTFLGTSIYLSPERVQGLNYGRAADIWSLGVCVYELASGAHPFENVNSFCDLFATVVCRDEAPQLRNSSSALQCFVNRCMTANPVDRLHTDQLADSFISRCAVTQLDFACWLDTDMTALPS